ncbi:hypothetical protein GYA19_05905 [Candidatus Beckwithbacteria bacterium]|nr:hypothetical protein [Candidatus Beckwithbacteria bacterium]
MKNIFLKALFKTMLSFAIFHMLFSAVFAIKTGNLDYLNVLRILNLEHYLPQYVHGAEGAYFSLFVFTTVYLVILILIKKKSI